MTYRTASGALRAAAALLAALSLAAASAAAHEFTAGDLRLDHPWTRATAPGAKVAGGYLEIENGGGAPDRLIGGSADFAARVEIHEMSMDGGVMRMRPIDGGLEIPAGGAATLEPGGYHVMFMGLTEPLVEGEKRAATLLFERAGAVSVEFVVEGPGAKSSKQDDHDLDHDHDHGGKHDGHGAGPAKAN